MIGGGSQQIPSLKAAEILDNITKTALSGLWKSARGIQQTEEFYSENMTNFG